MMFTTLALCALVSGMQNVCAASFDSKDGRYKNSAERLVCYENAFHKSGNPPSNAYAGIRRRLPDVPIEIVEENGTGKLSINSAFEVLNKKVVKYMKQGRKVTDKKSQIYEATLDTSTIEGLQFGQNMKGLFQRCGQNIKGLFQSKTKEKNYEWNDVQYLKLRVTMIPKHGKAVPLWDLVVKLQSKRNEENTIHLRKNAKLAEKVKITIGKGWKNLKYTKVINDDKTLVRCFYTITLGGGLRTKSDLRHFRITPELQRNPQDRYARYPLDVKQQLLLNPLLRLFENIRDQ